MTADSKIISVDAVGKDAAVARVAARLRAGGLVVIPTDTVYGLAAHPDCPAAVEHLFTVKGRDAAKAIPLLIADAGDAHRFGAELSPFAARLAARFWPGALTLVLPVGGTDGRTEGFRVPASTITRALLRAVGGGLRVTSANRSGEPPATTADAALQALDHDVDLVLDAGPASHGVASTVARLAGDTVDILRVGVITADDLRAAGVRVS
ncbi:MAG: threonylcarbamoyl-AMP synthase [Lentisphaerae bacterium]|nr:threonylcarbamoyl-AMP synthase [Lentisphaerota bacterium]